MAKKKAKTGGEIDPANLDTYYKIRMHSMGIVNPTEHFYQVEGEAEMSGYKQPIFQETEAGNIQINYPSLFGGAEVIGGTEIPFSRLRYKPENQPDPKVKYFQQPGSGVHIFFPPAIVAKFKAGTEIPKLIMVEGEVKAMAGSLAGMDIVGLGGKDSFRNEDKNGLHPDLIRLIQDCRIETVVLLTDADTLAVKWDHESEPEKDLSKSLWGFRNTVINFREACINAGIKDCYFARLQLQYLRQSIHADKPEAGTIKGLDDLLENRRIDNTIHNVTSDIDRLTGARVFFEVDNVGAMQPVAINKIFWLNPGRGGVPQSFYTANSELLKNLPFKFRSAVYQMNSETGLECVKHADSDEYIRIECDYYKMIEVPDPNGDLQTKLIGWKVSEITRDYGNAFHKGIKKFNANCNVPCHTSDYQQIVNGCYNRYYPLNHKLEEGLFPSITAFLKHIFGERELVPALGDKQALTNYDLALDYITILYQKPTQPLPIGVLYSAEGNTGKSTFLWLLECIFLANYGEVTNDILEDGMNDDWATKLVIGMDEGFIEKNKIYQKLKSLSTAHKIMMRGMYASRKSVPFFGKFWITTNDKGFIKLEKNETRFWINEVPVLKTIDPEFLNKMQAEVPAFLYHIANREILFPKKSRHWFAPELLVTEMGNLVKENSKGWLQSELETILPDLFFKTKWHTLHYSIEEMEELLNSKNKAVKYRQADIRKQMAAVYNKHVTFARHKHPKILTEEINDFTPLDRFTVKHYRCFTFYIEEFVPKDQIIDLSEYFNLSEVMLTRPNAVAELEEAMP